MKTNKALMLVMMMAMPSAFADSTDNVCEGQGRPVGKWSRAQKKGITTGCMCQIDMVVYPPTAPGNASNPCIADAKKRQAMADEISKHPRPIKAVALQTLALQTLAAPVNSLSEDPLKKFISDNRVPMASIPEIDSTLSIPVQEMVKEVQTTHNCPIKFDDIPALLALAKTKLGNNEHIGVDVQQYVGKNDFVCGYNYTISEWKQSDVTFTDVDTYISNLSTDYTINKRHTSGEADTIGYWFQHDDIQDKAGESSYRGGPGIPRNPDFAFFRLSEHVLLEIVSNYGEIGFVGILAQHEK